MWITHATLAWIEQREQERSSHIIEERTLRHENTLLRETLAQKIRDVDWLRVRCNQLEQERAALLLKLNGVLVPTPIISHSFSPEDQTAFQALDSVGGEAPD